MVVSRLKLQIQSDESVEDEQDGPFVVQKGDVYLFIWADDPSRRGDMARGALKELGEYFEPLLSVAETRNRTALSLAKKLVL
ncbi:MAG: hypothetical protein M1482_15100 [Chloroflexi bacterium]|nr:hypothetical protein [Chloroflexota bacterium]